MSIAKETLSRFEETVNGYIRDLEGTSMDQLLWKPAEDEWSLGQMYMHLIRSARFMHLRNVALCLDPNGSPEVTQAGKTEQGEKVFKMGDFPADTNPGGPVPAIHAAAAGKQGANRRRAAGRAAPNGRDRTGGNGCVRTGSSGSIRIGQGDRSPYGSPSAVRRIERIGMVQTGRDALSSPFAPEVASG